MVCDTMSMGLHDLGHSLADADISRQLLMWLPVTMTSPESASVMAHRI